MANFVKVVTFTYKPSLVKIDALNFQLSWQQTHRQTHRQDRWMQCYVASEKAFCTETGRKTLRCWHRPTWNSAQTSSCRGLPSSPVTANPAEENLWRWTVGRRPGSCVECSYEPETTRRSTTYLELLSISTMTKLFHLFSAICVFCLLVVLVRLSVPVQVIDWKDSSLKWAIMCWWGH